MAASHFCFRPQPVPGEGEVFNFWILGLWFPHQYNRLAFGYPQNKRYRSASAHPLPGREKSKACERDFTAQEGLLLSLTHLSKRQGGQRTPILFWSWPVTGGLTFLKSLNSSDSLCEMTMGALWSPACLRGWLHKERGAESLGRVACRRHVPEPPGWPDT